MKINKKIWWIPIVGIIYIIYMGNKYGFYTPISNPFNSWESNIGNIIHVISFLSPFIIYFVLC